MSFWRRRFEFKDEEYLFSKHTQVSSREVWVQGRGVPKVLQAYPGEFLEEMFEFKDEEYLEFSKLTQVSS